MNFDKLNISLMLGNAANETAERLPELSKYYAEQALKMAKQAIEPEAVLEDIEQERINDPAGTDPQG